MPVLSISELTKNDYTFVEGSSWLISEKGLRGAISKVDTLLAGFTKSKESLPHWGVIYSWLCWKKGFLRELQNCGDANVDLIVKLFDFW